MQISELKEKLNSEIKKNKKLPEANPALVSTLKNSSSPDKTEEKNDNMAMGSRLIVQKFENFLVKSSLKSESEGEHQEDEQEKQHENEPESIVTEDNEEKQEENNPEEINTSTEKDDDLHEIESELPTIE